MKVYELLKIAPYVRISFILLLFNSPEINDYYDVTSNFVLFFSLFLSFVFINNLFHKARITRDREKLLYLYL